MADMIGIAMYIAKRGMALLQFVISVYVIATVLSVKQEWLDNLPSNVKIYDIKHPDFWGPLHILVPKTSCSSKEVRRLQADSPTAERTFLSMGDVFADCDENEDPPCAVPRQLAGFEINCNSALTTYDAPDGTQNYFAAIFLSLKSSQGEETTSELISTTRNHLCNLMIVGLIVMSLQDLAKGMFGRNAELGYLMMVVQGNEEMAEMMYPKEKTWHELWAKSSGSKKTCGEKVVSFITSIPIKLCKQIKMLVVKFPAQAQKFLNQLALLSLFAVYADGGHFLMSYVPGVAYILNYVQLGFALLLVSLAACAVCAEGEGTAPCVMCCGPIYGCMQCIWFPLVTLPLLGYSFYMLNFLWATHEWGGNKMEGKEAMSISWPGTMDVMHGASIAVFDCNLAALFFDSFFAALDA